MLKDEQLNDGKRRVSQQSVEPLSYGTYLRIPELLDLQTLLVSGAHDEMLFIILQQIQELWFKQVLFELKAVIALIGEGNLLQATRLLDRVNRIVKALAEEAAILETMPPQEFHLFRHVLAPASGFESEQFRELEFASGLADHTFVKLMDKHLGMMDALRARWPVTLHEAWLGALAEVAPDPVAAVVEIYNNPAAHPELYRLAEALSEYEVLFSEWRFHHIKLVERTIGDHSAGTGGSTGAGYLSKTLGYRFFPELWAARNRLTEAGSQVV